MSTTTKPTHLPKLPPLPINTDDICKNGFTNTAHWVIPNKLMQGARPAGFGLSSDTTLQDHVLFCQRSGMQYICLCTS